MGTHSTTPTREEINPKSTARQQATVILRRLAPAWNQNASLAIQEQAEGLPEFKSARAVACYLAQPREVQTRAIAQACWNGGRRLAVPAYDKSLSRYGLAWLNENDSTHDGIFGIAEPVSPVWAKPTDIDLLVVPCLAFDIYGRRLGHGGGHFDRLLGGHCGLKICLAFEAQRLVAVPAEPHDIPVDLIITEKNIYDARANRK